jgi:hypothetical protein
MVSKMDITIKKFMSSRLVWVARGSREAFAERLML